jgi:hypothetical protein
MPSYEREVVRTFEAGGQPRLDVRTISGSVTASGEDRADVSITARASFRAADDAEADELMAAIAEGINHQHGRVNAHAPDLERGSLFGIGRRFPGRGSRFELDFDVRMPLGSSLGVKIVNGSLEVARLGGEARIHIVNGRFELTDVGGDVSMHYVNARGSLHRVGGALDVDYTNGDLDAEDVAGALDLHLVNGRVGIRNPGGSVKVRGVSGAYELTGQVRGDVSMTSAHGKILLNVPRDSRFRLDATSTLGSVTSELDVREAGGGQGDAPNVSLHSETGRIEIRALRETAPAAV